MLMYKTYLEEIIKETEEIICKISETKDLEFAVFFCFRKKIVSYSPGTMGPRERHGSLSALFSLLKRYSKSILLE